MREQVRSLIVVVGFSLAVLGCTKKEAPIESAQTETLETSPTQPVEAKPSTSAPVAAAAANAPAKRCPNGSAPQITKGTCTGTWKIRTAEGKSFCDFEWGPKVSCAQGSQPLGNPTFCYGVTTKPADAKIQTAADCLSAYTNAPISPNYTLECCS